MALMQATRQTVVGARGNDAEPVVLQSQQRKTGFEPLGYLPISRHLTTGHSRPYGGNLLHGSRKVRNNHVHFIESISAGGNFRISGGIDHRDSPVGFSL
jgi:hypothetical protein